mmetsp:Transcript_9631/g.26071  ORF Transcript_9631/g.26071 Transcript_9631/m.26071 type:complete len:297 (-) Transcript_9631:1372-2262(-)
MSASRLPLLRVMSIRGSNCCVEGVAEGPAVLGWLNCTFEERTLVSSSSWLCSCRSPERYSFRISPTRKSNVSLVIHLLPATSWRAAAEIITCTRFSDSAVVPPVSPLSPMAFSTNTFSRCASSMCWWPCSWICSMSTLLILMSCFNWLITEAMLSSSAPMAFTAATSCTEVPGLDGDGLRPPPPAVVVSCIVRAVGDVEPAASALASIKASTFFSKTMILSSMLRMILFTTALISEPPASVRICRLSFIACSSLCTLSCQSAKSLLLNFSSVSFWTCFSNCCFNLLRLEVVWRFVW